MNRPGRPRPARVLSYAAAVLIAIWVLVPIYLITLAAFSPQQAIYTYPKPLLPYRLSAETLVYFFNSNGVLPSLQRSVAVACLTLGVSLILGTPAAYALARFRFRGADAVRLTIVATRAFPIVILAIPLTVTFLQVGIDDTVYAVAFVHTVLALPFVVLVMAAAFTAISAELEEAAMVLGCTRPAAFWRIVLPLARPGLATAAIFTFIVSWNEVFAASVVTVQHRTLPAQILATLNMSPVPYQYAAGFVMLAPSIAVVFAIRRYLLGNVGLMVSA